VGATGACATLAAALALLGSDGVSAPAAEPARDGRGGFELKPLASFKDPIYVHGPSGAGGLVFVVEQRGVIRMIKGGKRLAGKFLDIRGRVEAGGERGLLSVAFSPAYRRNGRLYVFFTDGDGDLRVEEYRRSRRGPRDAREASARRVIEIDHSANANHNGGQLQFGPDGKLYISTGDGGAGGDPPENAQNKNVLLGKILRIDPRRRRGKPYTVPPDNPFVGRPGANEIFSLGLRNPFRFSFDRNRRRIAIGDVGQDRREEVDFDLLDHIDNPHFERYTQACYERLQRQGYSPKEVRGLLWQNPTALAAMMLALGDADAMICGTIGRYGNHLKLVEEIVGREKGVNRLTSMNALVLHTGTLFIADTYVQEDPSAEELAEIVALCSEEVLWFGIEPKVALLSHSNFGSHDSPSARKMHLALEFVQTRMPDLEVEGEMHADLALSEELRKTRFPNSRLRDRANLLIMPNQDAANVAFNMLKVLGEGVAIGPILIGAAKSAHIVTPSITVRGLLNMTALASVRASCQMKQ